MLAEEGIGGLRVLAEDVVSFLRDSLCASRSLRSVKREPPRKSVAKSMAQKLRDLREPQRLNRLDELPTALHYAAAAMDAYGAWVLETSSVTAQPGDSWMFSRDLTPES